ncbi:MAG TPA: thiamine-binding protein [Acidimicrobiales bacterium]|nr:thiamine-binding protein [Acidimicrobiales bacterium]
MIVEIQCIPEPAGTTDGPFARVHAAIQVIEVSGLAYEVGPCGTSIEGTPEQLWPLLQRIHEATLAAGASSCLSVIKVFQQTGEAQATMTSLTDRYREQ